MRDIWDEIDVMVSNPSCDCKTSMPYVEHLMQQRLLQFLIGLNESFAQVRSSILLNSNVPSVNQAYAMAIQEENQRQLDNTDSGSEPLTMLAGRNSNVSNNLFHNQVSGRASHNQSQVHHQGQSSQGRRSGTIICEHCGFKGHTKYTCYRIIVFPVDFKSKRKSQPDVFKPHVNNVIVEAESNEEGKFSFPGGYFTRVQYNEALKKLYPTGSCKANAQVGASHHITYCEALLNKTKSVDNSKNNKELSNGKVIGIGREVDGLYILKNHITPTFGAVIKAEDDQRLWHLGLGHLSVGIMKTLKHKMYGVLISILRMIESTIS
ncbi:hypothetical protein KY284_030398 [Solanum tuberosum]|nr:hypothetical protein KY284_030398 [Solanum tuberosum]